MKQITRSLFPSIILMLVVAGQGQNPAPATNSPSLTDPNIELLKEVDQLIDQNEELTRQNQELMQRIVDLRQLLERRTDVSGAPAQSGTSPHPLGQPAAQGAASVPSEEGGESAGKAAKYTPNFGYRVADTRYGDVNISILAYVRYLNQRNLDPTFTNAFGATSTIQQRQDIQLNKVQIKFLGWVWNPKFRYYLYAWTNNAAAGLPGSIYLAGNVHYDFADFFTLGGGVTSLPGTRSVEGNFPFWLSVDSRLVADEFFRPSYTMGVWARGKIARGLTYQAMVGNNLSTIGVNAGQLDNGLNTFSGNVVWTPTKAEYGIGFGDFENHQEMAARLGIHFTRSDENKQSQPSTEAPENTQLRLSDGSIIFKPDLFGPGVTVTDARYRMVAADGGIKSHGFELWAEGFWRWLDDFRGPGTSAVPSIFDSGFQVQASSMVVQKTLQLYAGGSLIYGKYGQPYDARAVVNWFPYKNKVLRWNNEVLYLYKAPAGYTAVPFALGGRGWVFHSNVELAF